MKTSQFITGIFSLIIMICNTVAYAKDVIPNEIKEVVINTYPEAENIIWKEYSTTEYLAYFIVGDEEIDVFIDNQTGKIIESITHLTQENIPQPVLDHVASIENCKLYYVLETDFPNHSRFYIAKVKIDGEMYEINFNGECVYLSQYNLK